MYTLTSVKERLLAQQRVVGNNSNIGIHEHYDALTQTIPLPRPIRRAKEQSLLSPPGKPRPNQLHNLPALPTSLLDLHGKGYYHRHHPAHLPPDPFRSDLNPVRQQPLPLPVQRPAPFHQHDQHLDPNLRHLRLLENHYKADIRKIVVALKNATALDSLVLEREIMWPYPEPEALAKDLGPMMRSLHQKRKKLTDRKMASMVEVSRIRSTRRWRYTEGIRGTYRDDVEGYEKRVKELSWTYGYGRY